MFSLQKIDDTSYLLPLSQEEETELIKAVEKVDEKVEDNDDTTYLMPLSQEEETDLIKATKKVEQDFESYHMAQAIKEDPKYYLWWQYGPDGELIED